jgi:hypothetical protein
MNKYTFLLPLFISSVLLQGCGSKEASIQNKQSSLSTFLSIHSKYCAADYASAEQLASVLSTDPGFVLSPNHEGIYEKLVADVSYAVSPEETGCTTDLKIKTTATSSPYFGFEDINKALLAKGYKPEGEKEIRVELGLDNEELKVVEQKYLSKEDNTVSTLVFPLEREDQYYMTLYVEKFEIQGASLDVLPDTDLVEI